VRLRARRRATMSSCKKCGRSRVSGPHYAPSINMLRYVCLTCGYEWTTLARDALEEEEFERRAEALINRLRFGPSLLMLGVAARRRAYWETTDA
jgi:transposase-like protein